MAIGDVKGLVDYWIKSSDYDWLTARSLFKSRRFPYALFMAHLSLEKLLKGLLVKFTGKHAPFTHNLVYLAGNLSLDFSKEQIDLLATMNEFNLEARYPDERMTFYKKATEAFTKKYFTEARETREWLKKKF